MARNPIIGFIGDIGAGKTLTMTAFLFRIALAYKASGKKMTIYSNYKIDMPLDNIEFHDLTPKVFTDFFSKKSMDLKDVFFVLDEIANYADSYKWFSKDVVSLCRFALQSRKRNVRIFYTAQFMGLVPIRIRKISSLIIRPRYIEKKDLIRYEVDAYDGTMLYPVTEKKIRNASVFFPMYDTTEIVDIVE